MTKIPFKDTEHKWGKSISANDPDGPVEPENPTADKTQSVTNGPDGPPAWFQDDTDPAQLAKDKSKKDEKPRQHYLLKLKEARR